MTKRPSLMDLDLETSRASRPSMPASGPVSARASRPDTDAWGLLQLPERHAGVAPDAQLKGLVFQSAVDLARAAGKSPGRERYLAFKDYPFTEWLDVLVESARAAHPRLPPRDSLRRMGQLVFPRFEVSTLGKVILGAAGRNVAASLRVIPRVYAALGHSGTATVREAGHDHASIELRGFWDFPDAYHVGLFEGCLSSLGHAGTVRAEVRSLCDADLDLRW